MFVFHTSCGQSQTNIPQDNIKSGRGNINDNTAANPERQTVKKLQKAKKSPIFSIAEAFSG